jgi:hypothetical protein
MPQYDLVEDLRQKAIFNESQRTYNSLEWAAVAFEQKRIANELESWLAEREAVWKEVVEAGQAMRRYGEDEFNSTAAWDTCREWDAALSKLQGATNEKEPK